MFDLTMRNSQKIHELISLLIMVISSLDFHLPCLHLGICDHSVVFLAPVVQRVDNAILRINHYPLDIAIGFAITYPVDSDLSGG